MNNFAVELWDDEGSKCSFYTVRWLSEKESETEKFLNCYASSPFREDVQALFYFVAEIIGNQKGALPHYFRHERVAEALPPPAGTRIRGELCFMPHFPLRLYCLRVCSEIVILFNGAEKTAPTAQQGATAQVFNEANHFAKKINNAFVSKAIRISRCGRYLEPGVGDEMIL